MFERFNDTAKQVIVQSQWQAKALKQTSVGTEHLLLGVMLQPEPVTTAVFEAHGIEFQALVDRIKQTFGVGDEEPSGHLPFSDQAKNSLKSALEEALALGHARIGPEHLFLGLLSEGDGGAVRILVDLKTDPDVLSREIKAKLWPTASA
ncbi:Clp protease N-terminal domain-containing protein [Mycobacterium sp. URHB0021]|jgi:ATP-dependent Clp protease ATP-binding subunit ClpA